MKVSVCMCTYNGEAYIKEQLDSIISQTYKPDEIIVFDDCSSDQTLEIVKEYSVKNSNILWKIVKNEVNKGWKVNFHNAINECDGDYIFLADQDDIWVNTKIKNMIDIMNNNDIEVLACNFCIKNNNENSYIDKKNKSVEIIKVDNNSSLTHTKYPGCTYCFNKSIVPIYNEVYNENFPHDAMLWKIAYLREKLYVTNEIGVVWRRHDNCATNKIKNRFSEENVLIHYEVIKLYEKYFNALIKISGITKRNKKKMHDIFKMLEIRRKLYEKKSILAFIKLFRYINYFASKKAFLFEILALTNKNKIVQMKGIKNVN